MVIPVFQSPRGSYYIEGYTLDGSPAYLPLDPRDFKAASPFGGLEPPPLSLASTKEEEALRQLMIEYPKLLTGSSAEIDAQTKLFYLDIRTVYDAIQRSGYRAPNSVKTIECSSTAAESRLYHLVDTDGKLAFVFPIPGQRCAGVFYFDSHKIERVPFREAAEAIRHPLVVAKTAMISKPCFELTWSYEKPGSAKRYFSLHHETKGGPEVFSHSRTAQDLSKMARAWLIDFSRAITRRTFYGPFTLENFAVCESQGHQYPALAHKASIPPSETRLTYRQLFERPDCWESLPWENLANMIILTMREVEGIRSNATLTPARKEEAILEKMQVISKLQQCFRKAAEFSYAGYDFTPDIIGELCATGLGGGITLDTMGYGLSEEFYSFSYSIHRLVDEARSRGLDTRAMEERIQASVGDCLSFTPSMRVFRSTR